MLQASLCSVFALHLSNGTIGDNTTSIDVNPRVADVLQYMESNGGVPWIDTGSGTRYVFHTYEQWATAEKEVAGQDVDSFIARVVAGAALPAGQSSAVRPSAIPMTSKTAIAKRGDLWGTKIDGGLLLGRKAKDARYYCFNSGQWGITSAFDNFGTTACDAVMHDGIPDGVHTWQSQGYHQIDHQVAAWFIQSSGINGDPHASNVCRQIFDGFNEGKWCGGKSDNIGAEGGPFTTQGGYIRWFNSEPGTLFWGSQRGELRIDPNSCHKNGKPCSNIENVATVQQ